MTDEAATNTADFRNNSDDPVDAWLMVPASIEAAIAGMNDEALDRRNPDGDMTARETVHHLTEANLISASMMLAALGASGATFDWSWMWPNEAWIKRMGYSALPVGPPIATLKGLVQHMSSVIRARPDALNCEVMVFDEPGAETYALSVETILRNEAQHAAEHLAEIAGR